MYTHSERYLLLLWQYRCNKCEYSTLNYNYTSYEYALFRLCAITFLRVSLQTNLHLRCNFKYYKYVFLRFLLHV